MKKMMLYFIPFLVAPFVFSCGGDVKAPSHTTDYSKYTVACMGDSITYGYTPGSGAQMAEPYPTVLKKILGVKESRNYGISGSSVANGTGSWRPMVDRIKNIDISTNLIIFWGGGNDVRLDLPLGNEGDTETTNYYGALYNVCTYLNTNYKSAFKMFITPLPAKVSGTMYYLNDIKEAIVYTCNQFDIPVLNLTDNSGFEDEIEAGLNDGVHPTQDFVTNKLTPRIANFIKAHL